MTGGEMAVDSRDPVPASGAPAMQVVDFARRAPSIHNTQPWRWRVRGDRLDLYADRGRQLPVTDPSGRHLTISCGAALAHAEVAAAALGWRADAVAVDQDGGDHLGSLVLRPVPATPADRDDYELLMRRRTDRRRFTSWPVPSQVLDRLEHAVELPDVSIVPVGSPADRVRVELLVRQSRLIERATPGYLEEQATWVRGMPLDALDADGDRNRRASRFDAEPEQEGAEQVRATDGILVLCADRDEPPSWLRIGELLCRLWIRALREGLSVVPLSEPIEVAETREALHHQFLHGAAHPELLVRIGWQEIARSPLPPTPRRPLDDVVDG